MKKFIAFLALILLAISCNHPQSLLSRMEFLADDAVQRAEEYTEDDWEWSAMEFEDILSLYETEVYSFTEEENAQFSKAMGRYSGVVAKYGLKEFGEYANQLDSFIDAFDEGFEDTFEGVEDTLDEIFDNF